MNLTSLLKSSNILDEDGIEDLHFYFVSFNQHKNGILKLQERAEKPKHRKGKSVPPPGTAKKTATTLEFLDEEEDFE